MGSRGKGVTWSPRVKVLAAIDIYLMGLASVVQVAGSSYPAPAVARSVCVRDVVALNSEASGACPSWSRVFLRDFHKFVDGGRHVRHYAPCVQPALDDDHPCKGATSLQCRRRFVAATCV